MIFLFNDKLFEIGLPLEAVHAEGFPISPGAFSRLSKMETLNLLRSEIFTDPFLTRNAPVKASHLATIVAAKTNANALLVGASADGAKTAADIAVRLAEVSLLTLAQLYARQQSGQLTTREVEQTIWSVLRT